MNIHYVIAHPLKDSLNIAMKNHTTEQLNNQNQPLVVTDLYQLYKEGHPATKPFGVQRTEHDAILIKQQQKVIRQSQLTIIQFPIYWFSFPSIMHAYWEQLLEPGFAYPGTFDQSPLHDGRQVILVVTTQSSKKDYSKAGEIGEIEKILYPLTVMFRFVGFDVLKPFVAYDVANKNQAEIHQLIGEYSDYISQYV